MTTLQFTLVCLVLAAAAAGLVYLRAKQAQDRGDDPVATKRAQKGAIVRTVVFAVILVALYLTRNHS